MTEKLSLSQIKERVDSLLEEGSSPTTIETHQILLGLLGELGQYRDAYSQKIKEGLATARANGKALGGVPVGYERDTKTGDFVFEQKEQDTIDTIKALRLEGFTLREIADELNERGIPAKKGGKWHHSIIRKILQR